MFIHLEQKADLSRIRKYVKLKCVIFNPNHVINLDKLTYSPENIRSNELKQCFQNKIAQLATRQPKNLRKILTKAKFEENPLLPLVKEAGFSLCSDSIYHRRGYFKLCKFFQFKANDKSMIWDYKRYFNCDSKNVIYILTSMLNTCQWVSFIFFFSTLKIYTCKHKIYNHQSYIYLICLGMKKK